MRWQPGDDSFFTRDDSGATDRIPDSSPLASIAIIAVVASHLRFRAIGSRIWMARIGYTDCSGLTAVQLPEKGPTTLGTPREFGRYFSQLAKTTFAGSNPLTPGREYT
jgi:hypothetical protein